MLTPILALALVGSVAAQSSSAAPSSAAPSSAAPAASSAAAAPATTTQAPASNTNGAIEPLASKSFTWGDLPYQVDTNPTGRGPQSGYNICNSTTAGPNSLCQTSFLDSVSDFCLWGAPQPNSTVGDVEASSVAWCTTNAHGARVMPAGTITAVQFLRAPAYIQVTGLINQVNINWAADDGGGELDPHGADGRGNPLGALVFSSGFPASNGNLNDFIQATEWHSFMGSDTFCFKACDPSVAGSTAYCDNLFDRIGCAYNAPAAYAPNVFEACLSDNQDPPGTYTGADGQLTTYTQPAEALGAISTMPYTARIPASSSCTTYSSAQLFPASGNTLAASATVAGGSMTTTKAPTTGTAAASSSTSSSQSAAGAQLDGIRFGGAVVVALGALVGAAIVL